MAKNQIANNLMYLFAYKFRALFFFLAIVLLYFAFAENMIYLVFAVICIGLGIVAHIARNKVKKR